jgi:Ferric reductase like transmembrane component
MLAAIGGRSMWYLTRGSGIVALLMLTASVVLGIITSGRWEGRHWPRFVVEGLHRNVSLAVVVFLAIHVTTTVVDGFVPIGWLDVIIPLHSGYRPVWVGLGALAVDFLLAITITSLLRVRIGPRVWRGVHWLAYACWPIALVHGLGSGTDTPQRWMQAIDAVAMLTVVIVLGWRIMARRPAHPAGAPIALAAPLMVALGVGLFAWRGPLGPAWSSHGARLGAGAASASVGSPATTPTTSPTTPGSTPATTLPASSAAPTLPTDLTVAGGRSVTDSGGTRIVTLDMKSADGSVSVRIELTGSADASGGVVLDSGDVSVTLGGTAVWNGPVTGLHESTLTADLSGANGGRVALSADLSVDRARELVSSTVHLDSSTAGD